MINSHPYSIHLRGHYLKVYFSVKTKYLESELQHLLEDLAKTLLVVLVDKSGKEKLFPFLCFTRKNRGKRS